MIQVVKEIVGARNFSEAIERVKKGLEAQESSILDKGEVRISKSAKSDERVALN